MLTLKSKIVIALISLALVAVGIAGLSARTITLQRFDDLVSNRIRFDFMDQVLAYYREYGSWEAAAEQETYFEYVGRAPYTRREARPNAGTGTMASPRTTNPTAGRVGRAPPFVVADLDGKIWISGQTHEDGDYLPQGQLKYTLPIMDDDTQIGYVIPAQVAVVVELAEEAETAITSSWLFSILIALGVTIPVGIVLGGKIASPIHRLHEAVVAMQPGAVQQAVPVSSKDEIGQLSESFNIMSSEMASFVEIIEQQKAKILETEALRKEGMASISHELRTPLNNCVAQASAMLDGIRPMDEEQMSLLSGSLDHLTKLVDDLFQLALADVNALECAEEIVDFSVLINEALDTKIADLTRTNSELIRKLPDKLEVLGDAKRLRQIIDNLMENCFRYAEQGATIIVSLKREAEFAELTISDNGPGVPVEDLESIFDRFYRAETSRDRSSGGTGLGLSLVRAWAEAQGGSARAYLDPMGGGLGIKVYIPLARSHLQQNTAAHG